MRYPVAPIVLCFMALLGLAWGAPEDEVAGAEPGELVDSSTPEPTGALVITSVDDEGLAKYFSQRVDVFGIDVVASAVSPDDKLMHAASVMAEYLDNGLDTLRFM